MTDIPEDVMKSAHEAMCEGNVLRGNVVESAGRAILAERKRATLVAKTTLQNFFMERPDLMGLVPAIALRDMVVAAIESGGQ